MRNRALRTQNYVAGNLVFLLCSLCLKTFTCAYLVVLHNNRQNSWQHLGKSVSFVSKNHYLGGRNAARVQPRALPANRYAAP